MNRLIKMLTTLVAWGAGVSAAPRRFMTHDAAANVMAIPFRMNAGFPGDITRTHPFSDEPMLNDDAAPADAYGQFVVIDATGNAVRKISAADQSDAVSLMAWAITVRPFPTSPGGSVTAPGAASAFSSGSPAAGQVIGGLRQGYMTSVLNDKTQTPKKGDAVFIWCAASAGAQIQGGITNTFSAGNTVKLANAVFNGAGDAAGNVEVIIGDRRSL